MATPTISEDGVALVETSDSIVAASAAVGTTGTLWPELFGSPPTGGEAFSPARSMADKESLHGIGLQKCLEKGKLEAKCGRRVSLMLLEGASCYEQFGVALKKACQIQQHQLGSLTENGGDGDAFQSVVSLSQQTRKLASRLREDIALPLQEFHTNTQGETVVAMQQKYTQARQRAFDARQKALKGRGKYLSAAKEAEEARSEVQETLKAAGSNNTDNHLVTADKEEKVSEHAIAAAQQQEQQPTSDRSLQDFRKTKGQKAADKVTRLVNDAKVQQRRYESLVEKENEAVKFAQNMERIVLEGLQKLEEQRHCIFYSSLVQIFKELKTCLDNLVVAVGENVAASSSNDEVDGDGQSKSLFQNNESNPNKKGDFFATLLKVGHAREKTGVADADTLGLDEEVGRLRDEVQSRNADKIARIKKAKSLAAFLEDVAIAAAKLGSDLEQVAKHENSYVSSQGTPVEHLRTLISRIEGTRTLRLWNDTIKMLECEGAAFLQFATKLKSIKSSKFGSLLLLSEKLVSDEAEVDDGRWKVLCDAARAEMKAEGKYRQNTAQTAKARDRIRSVDKDSADEIMEKQVGKSPQKANRARDGMNKAFGNFLSILPDGGEQAMQMLTPEARRAVAERTLQEADQKEVKGRKALDNAIAHKNQCADAYVAKTTPLVKRYEEEEITGVGDLKVAMGDLFSSIDSLRTTRHVPLKVLSTLGDNSPTAALFDLSEWTQQILIQLSPKTTNTSSGNETRSETGFMLDAVLAESDFAGIGKANSFDSEGNTNADDASVGSIEVTEMPGQDSDRSLDFSKIKSEENSEQNTKGSKSNSRWLQKSFSAPLGKSGFKKLRKSHTTGDDEEDDFSTTSTTAPPQNKKEMFETDMFLTFWPDFSGTPPGVTNSFACAFLPKNCTTKDVGSVEHGRLFLTQKGAVFVAWPGKKAIIYFSAMTSVEKSSSMFGLGDDTLFVSAETAGAQTTLLLGSFNFRDTALDVMQSRMATARAKSNASKTPEATVGAHASKTLDEPVIPVAPDLIIQKMEIVLSKKIRGISIERFHEIVWSDKNTDDSFYGKWLGTGGKCSAIKVEKWQTRDDGIKGLWCADSYTHKRELDFRLKRNSRIGPPVAGVKQTQYVRLDGNDRSIMQMTVAFDGIPYSDTFSVEVRWVASRSGTRDISVQVGVFVHFHKSTMLKSTIKNGTMTETKPVHESLFEFVKAALAKEAAPEDSGDENIDDDDDEAVTTQTTDNGALGKIKSHLPEIVADNLHIAIPVAIVASFFLCRSMMSSSESLTLASGREIAALNTRIDSLEGELQLMRQTVKELKELINQ